MNWEFQIPVTGSTTPYRGLEVLSVWLCPQFGQYWAPSGSSALQYQQAPTGDSTDRVQNLSYDRPGRAFRGSSSGRAGRAAGYPFAAAKLRSAGRPAAGGGSSEKPDRLRSPPQHRALGTARQRQDDPGGPPC